MKFKDLAFYDQFERVVASFLAILIAAVVLFTCARLAVEVYELIIFKDDLMDPKVYLVIFGMILTVLIALEFNHSVIQIVLGKQSIIQLRIIVQIAILAIVRKLILMDLGKASMGTMLGLAALIVALAALYYVTRSGGLKGRENEPKAG